MNSEINLADILILKNSLVSCIGSVMGGAVVERASGRETNSRLHSVRLDQVAGAVLDHVANVDHRHSWLDIALGVLADLTMDLGSTTDVVVLIKHLSFQCALLLVCRSP